MTSGSRSAQRSPDASARARSPACSVEPRARLREPRREPPGPEHVHPGAAHDAAAQLGEGAHPATDGDAARPQHADDEGRRRRRGSRSPSALGHLQPAGSRLHHPPDPESPVGPGMDADERAVVLGGDGESPQLLRHVGHGLTEQERLEAVRRPCERVELLRRRDHDAHPDGAVLVAQQARLVRDRQHALEVRRVHEDGASGIASQA